MHICFRNFKNCVLTFSHYENGNICVKLFSESHFLREITCAGKEQLQECLLLKDIPCNETIIGSLMWENIILGCFPKRDENGQKMYYCPLNKKYFQQEENEKRCFL